MNKNFIETIFGEDFNILETDPSAFLFKLLKKAYETRSTQTENYKFINDVVDKNSFRLQRKTDDKKYECLEIRSTGSIGLFTITKFNINLKSKIKNIFSDKECVYIGSIFEDNMEPIEILTNF